LFRLGRIPRSASCYSVVDLSYLAR
jgi:hypothetical protein